VDDRRSRRADASQADFFARDCAGAVPEGLIAPHTKGNAGEMKTPAFVAALGRQYWLKFSAASLRIWRAGRVVAVALIAIAGGTMAFAQDDETESPGAEKKPAGETARPKAKPKTEPTKEPETLEAMLQEVHMPPIQFPATSISSYNFEKQRGEWLKRRLIPAIDRELDGTLEDPKKRTLVETMIGTWAGTEISQMQKDYSYSEFGKRVTDLVSPGANAPVFQAFAGFIALTGHKREDAPVRWRMTLDRLDPAKAPGMAGLMAAGELLRGGFIKPDEPGLNEKILSFEESAMRADQWDEGDVHFLVNFLITFCPDFLIKPRAERMLELVRASKLPEWAKLTLVGRCELKIAETYRRSEPGFEQHLEKARETLTEAWKLRPDRPEAATEMLQVTYGSPAPRGEAMRLWFDRAIAAQCDYEPAYELMRASFHPRWGGTPVELAAFALTCAEADRPALRIGGFTMPALIDLSAQLGDWRPVFKSPSIQKLVIGLRQKIVARQTEPYGTKVMNAYLAVEAWLCGDYPTAAAALEKVGDSRKLYFVLPPQALADLKRLAIEPREFTDDCRVRGGKFKEAFLTITKAREEGKRDVAVAAVNELMKDKEPLQDPYLFALGNMAGFEKDFEQQGWREPPMAFSAWRCREPGWTRTPRTIETFGPKLKQPYLLQASLGDRYELKGRVDFPKKIGRVYLGFVFGSPKIAMITGVAIVGNAEDGKTIRFMVRDGLGPEVSRVPLPGSWTLPEPGDPLAFRVRREGQRLSVWLDDKLVVDRQEMSTEMTTGPSAFGLLASGGTDEDRVIISELKVRPLGVEL
jgi:hypothetical protein